MNEKKTRLPIIQAVALVCLGMMAGMPGLSSPIVQTAIEAYPDVATSTVRMLVTLPNLVSTFVGLAMGVVVGKKMTYKSVTLIGTAFAIVGGLGPVFFYSNFMVVLFFRFLLGFGAATAKYRGGLVMQTVGVEKSATLIGFGMASSNIMHMILQPVAGALADKQFNLAFLVYLITIPLFLLFAFGLKEPPKPETPKAEDKKEAAPKQKEKFNPWLIALMAIALLNISCLYAFNTGVSSYVVDKGVGTAVVAGTALSMYTFAGMAGNILLKPISKLLGKYQMAVMDLCIAIGLFVLIRATGTVGIYAAGLLCGFGYITCSSALQLACGKISTPGTVALAATLVTCISGIGSFVSSYYITFAHAIIGAGSETESAYTMSIFVFIALAVFAFVFANKLYGRKEA